LLVGNGLPIIVYLDSDLALGLADRNPYRACLRRILDGIGNKVDDHLPDARIIGIDHDRSWRGLPDNSTIGTDLQRFDDLSTFCREITMLYPQWHLLCTQEAQIKDILD